MHVLVAAHDFYPDPGSGGTGRYVYETARELVERGHAVSVVTRRRGDVPERETIAGIDVFRYDVSVTGESAPTIAPQLPRASRTVRELVRAATADRPADAVSFQGPLTSLLVDRAIADSVPRVLTFHSPWPTEYDIKARNDPTVSSIRRRINVELRKRAERRVVRAADRIIVLSEYMAGQLERVYGRDDAAVVPGGVDVELFSPAVRESSRVDADGASFLTVRRLSERMGHDVLIEGFGEVAADHPDAELFVAGDGPLRDELEERAAKAGIEDRVTFLGYVPDDDLPAIYAGADVFVLPTTQLEGFGLATMEALASGTPVVGTAVGGTVEILGKLASSRALPAEPLVPRAEPRPLAESLSAWASLDEPELDGASVAAREFARTYAWSNVVGEIEAEYVSIVGEIGDENASVLTAR